MGEPLVDPEASSRNLKTQTKMISIIKASLKGVDDDAYNKFCQTFLDAKGLTEQKRAYMCRLWVSKCKRIFEHGN